MRICRKCSKQVSDESKICRDCGAILEDIMDVGVPGLNSQPEYSSPSGLSSAVESRVPKPECGDDQLVGEVGTESVEPTPPGADASAWKCDQCGEMVPDTFDVCWKCLTTKDGEKTDQGEPVFFQEVTDGGSPDEEPDPSKLYAKALGMEEDEGERPQSVCPRCGSSKMMLGVTVRDQGDGSNGTLQVFICGDPSALIFKDRLYGELRANICGDCGHVELRVTNAGELYRHYRKSIE